MSGLPERLPLKDMISCLPDPINLTLRRCYVNLGVRRGRMPKRDWVICVIHQHWSRVKNEDKFRSRQSDANIQ